jgi:hypothetical protein
MALYFFAIGYFFLFETFRYCELLEAIEWALLPEEMEEVFNWTIIWLNHFGVF